jgi:transcriptional regulator with XRE-family HTH domain
MQLNSDKLPIATELRDPEIRQHTVESQIKIGIPFQIRSMREHRGWTQEKLAEKIGTTQNTISRLENPKTGKPTITTLLRIANACDVGLLVRFVPFGFYGDVIQAMDQTHLEVPSYDEELKNQINSDYAVALNSYTAVPATVQVPLQNERPIDFVLHGKIRGQTDQGMLYCIEDHRQFVKENINPRGANIA